MIPVADRFGPWAPGFDAAEFRACLRSNADARGSCFSGLVHCCTFPQCGRDGGGSCVDSSSPIISIIATIISIRIVGCLIIVWKFLVYPIAEHLHGLIIVGREIATSNKICAPQASARSRTLRRSPPTEKYLERSQKAHEVHQCGAERRRLGVTVAWRSDCRGRHHLNLRTVPTDQRREVPTLLNAVNLGICPLTDRGTAYQAGVSLQTVGKIRRSPR